MQSKESRKLIKQYVDHITIRIWHGNKKSNKFLVRKVENKSSYFILHTSVNISANSFRLLIEIFVNSNW